MSTKAIWLSRTRVTNIVFRLSLLHMMAIGSRYFEMTKLVYFCTFVVYLCDIRTIGTDYSDYCSYKILEQTLM